MKVDLKKREKERERYETREDTEEEKGCMVNAVRRGVYSNCILNFDEQRLSAS